MELPQGLIDAVRRKAHAEQEMRDLTGGKDRTWLDISPKQMLTFIEEIERLRAVVAQQATENAALRTALQTIEVLMSDISDDEQLRRAVNSAANAGLLNAKPDAAPAPVENAIKVGDLVEIAKDGYYMRGHVKAISGHRCHVAPVQLEGELTQEWMWFNHEEITVLARPR